MLHVARSRIVRHDESPLEACLRERGYGDVADELGVRHAYTGRSGGSGGAASRYDLAAAGAGFVAETFDNASIQASQALTAGRTYMGAVGLLAGDAITNLSLMQGAALAVGAAPTLFKLGIFDSTFKAVAVTADVKADAQLTGGPASGDTYEFPLTATYTVTASGLYYLGVLLVGAWATTQPQFGYSPNFLGNGGGLNSKKRAWQKVGTADIVVGTTYAAPSGVNNFPWLACR